MPSVESLMYLAEGQVLEVHTQLKEGSCWLAQWGSLGQAYVNSLQKTASIDVKSLQAWVGWKGGLACHLPMSSFLLTRSHKAEKLSRRCILAMETYRGKALTASLQASYDHTVLFPIPYSMFKFSAFSQPEIVQVSHLGIAWAPGRYTQH